MRMVLQRTFDCVKETYRPYEILRLVFVPHWIDNQPPAKPSRMIIDNDPITMHSVRLRTFKEHGITCVKCGIEGQFFRKEKLSKDLVYHINLYAIDKMGNEVLMTKDHIIPKSKGGRNHISNMQTMCVRCNTAKGNKEHIKYENII